MSSRTRHDRVHLDAGAVQRGPERARERDLRVLRGRVRCRGREHDRPGGRRDRRNVRASLRPRGLPEPVEQATRHPHAAEVVDDERPLDLVDRRLDEAAADEDARAVHEQVDGGMPLEDARRCRGHRLAIRDVADLDLGLTPELQGEALELVLATRDEYALPSLAREQPGRLLPDARRGARDDGDPGGCVAHSPPGGASLILAWNVGLFATARSLSFDISPGTTPKSTVVGR